MHTYYWAPTLKGYNSVGLGWCLEIQISNLSGSDAGGYIDGTWRDPGISVSTVDKTWSWPPYKWLTHHTVSLGQSWDWTLRLLVSSSGLCKYLPWSPLVLPDFTSPSTLEYREKHGISFWGKQDSSMAMSCLVWERTQFPQWRTFLAVRPTGYHIVLNQGWLDSNHRVTQAGGKLNGLVKLACASLCSEAKLISQSHTPQIFRGFWLFRYVVQKSSLQAKSSPPSVLANKVL